MTDEHDGLLDALLSAFLLSALAKLAWKRCFAEARKSRKGKRGDKTYRHGFRDGARKGYGVGVKEGYRRHAATTLRAMLGSRFGPLPADIVARIDSASNQ